MLRLRALRAGREKKISGNEEGGEALSKVGSARTGLFGVSESPIARDGKEQRCLVPSGAGVPAGCHRAGTGLCAGSWGCSPARDGENCGLQLI